MATEMIIESKDLYSPIGRLRRGVRKRADEVASALSDAAELVLTRAKTHYLTGAALRVQTGRLRSSVSKDPATGAYRAGNVMFVKVGTNVHYGRAWEFGFTVPSYEIRPRWTKALRFEVGGREVFAKRVRIPSRTEPARPWLRPSVEDEMPNIIRILERAGVSFLPKEGKEKG